MGTQTRHRPTTTPRRCLQFHLPSAAPLTNSAARAGPTSGGTARAAPSPREPGGLGPALSGEMRAPSPEGPQPRSASPGEAISRPGTVPHTGPPQPEQTLRRTVRTRAYPDEGCPAAARYLLPSEAATRGASAGHTNPPILGRPAPGEGAERGWAGRRHRMRRKPGACRLTKSRQHRTRPGVLMVLCQGAEAAAVAPAAGKEPEGPQGREDGTDTGRPCLQPAAGVEAAGAEERRVCGCCPGWPWPRCCRAPGEEGEAGWQAEQGGSALSAGRRCRRGGGRGNGPEGSGAEWHAVAGRGVSPGGR